MNRCEFTGRRGQCTKPVLDGSEFCRKHGDETDRIRGYRISDPKLKERMGYHNDEESFQSLKQELVILRMMVEETLEGATSTPEKQAAFITVTPWVAQIQKLVESLTKLSQTTSELVSKEALHRLAEQWVHILSQEMENVYDRDDIIDRVAKRLTETVMDLRN